MITTRQQLLYSVSATRRLLSLAAEIALKVREFERVMWVHVAGHRPTFISKSVYRQHFVERRRKESQKLIARNQGDYWVVYNPAKQTSYCVEALPAEISCNCEDYGNQIKLLGRGCCKHGYAVLAQLGFTNLRDYLATAK
jgi:hypothetical protein